MESPSDSNKRGNDEKEVKESKATKAKGKIVKGGKSVGKFFKQKAKQLKETTKAIAEFIDDEIHHREHEDLLEFKFAGKTIFSSGSKGSDGKFTFKHPKDASEVKIPPSEEIAKIHKMKSSMDAHASHIPKEEEESPERLAAYLVKPFTSDLEKFRAIFYFLAHNIQYDVKSLFDGTESPSKAKDVLATKKAVCQGYANLFHAMCKVSGLKSWRIGGQANPSRFQISIGEDLGHAWNAIVVDGFFYQVDCTWAAGSVQRDSTFQFGFDDFYFVPKPSQLIHTHFPDWNPWQLLEKQITFSDFKELANVKSSFFKQQIELATHFKNIIEAEAQKEFLVTVVAPEKVKFMCKLMMLSGVSKKWEEIPANHCYYERKTTQRHIHVILPSSGNFKLELYSKESRGLIDSESSELYEMTLSYKIMCTGGVALSVEDVKKLQPPFPESFTKFQKEGHQLHESKSGILKVNEAVMFKISAEAATKMSVVIKGKDRKENWIPLTRDKEFFQGKVTPSSTGKATLFAQYPTSEKDRFLALLQYNIN